LPSALVKSIIQRTTPFQKRMPFDQSVEQILAFHRNVMAFACSQ
jgi:hypothetical protein